jgi:hypothetical protein
MAQKDLQLHVGQRGELTTISNHLRSRVLPVSKVGRAVSEDLLA